MVDVYDLAIEMSHLKLTDADIALFGAVLIVNPGWYFRLEVLLFLFNGIVYFCGFRSH